MRTVHSSRSGMLLAAIAFASVVVSAAAPEARWVQSYDAGYLDAKGAYAGGSEIMHLVAHKGKLYAANGYWVDARWVIPPDAEKQSAQVLRLDSSDGRWQIDLDMGKNNERGLRYMKGNILKSVTFTRDAAGGDLPQPESLLVMAAGATLDRGGAVSVWVRSDEDGSWRHTLVRHGSNAGGIRWVPRDMEVHRDKVTGEERLFLSLGNPGIVTGVYDPSHPEKIRWERHLEFPFPDEGTLRVRPLGFAKANGSLFFSAGGSIYRRLDGPRPTYREVIRLGAEADADLGGIRGLTTIANPTGKGESLLFLWAPGERARGQIKRADPDGHGRFSLHDEGSILDLMSAKLGVEVRNTLGAHNQMYPVVHPRTGETVHLVGFQGGIRGKEHFRWKPTSYYAGALYAIRAADGSYTVHEVNGAYAPGKTPLVTPRAFCLSPFGDDQLFIGGHDANFRVSDDMAWVFRAPLEVGLGLKPGNSAKPSGLESPRLAGMEDGPVYELRIYVANEDRFDHLLKRFREHTDRLFRKHGMEPVGYWLPVEGTPRERRTFYYILKHPSRYAAHRNWNNFANDREWQRVLDKPEFQRLLNDKPGHSFMTPSDYSAEGGEPIEKRGGIYELRTYVAEAGQLVNLNVRFREHTKGFFEKHGMKIISCWIPQDRPESASTLICLVHHASRAQADANWTALLADPAWRKVARALRVDGEILAQPPQRVFLKATEYSPLK